MATSKRKRRTLTHGSAGGPNSPEQSVRDWLSPLETESSRNAGSGTGKSLGALLIDAQEQERKRVARELHDGVSQELAVISIQVAQARLSTSDEAVRSTLEKVYDKLQQVLSDVGHMSHQLHPSTLKHLGLSAAIKVLCDDVSRAHGINVGFTDKGAPQPACNDTALCLYRVTQEALHNVVKHSRCNRAWVELGCNNNEITLYICDQGVGFNPHTAKTGLGLVSMRERLHLIGGRMGVTSRRGSGTRIEAYAPIARSKGELAA